MNIVKADSAGFCFGVDRAVKLSYDLLAKGNKIAVLGPLIHNQQVVDDLTDKGAITVNTINQIPNGYDIIIRSHGVAANIYTEISEKNIALHDATCPFVKKIQRLAEKAGSDGNILFIAGDLNHPEVQGIIGHTTGEVVVFNNLLELQKHFNGKVIEKNIVVVAQTTFEVTKWLECQEFLKKVCTNAKIFDTICSATWTRQKEAEELSQKCDLMVIIGGKHSSNTQKLYSVAAKHTHTVLVETASEIKPDWFVGVKTAGVTAGASTPASIIEEVLSEMSEVINDQEMSFEEMLEQSFKPIFTNKQVKGIVTGISPNEITVDIGAKSTGFVHISEMTNDPNAKIEDLVKKGDELDLLVIKTNDQEGIVQLSRIRLEAREGHDEVKKASEENTEIEVFVTEAVKGGLVAIYKGVKIFIPASQATVRRGEDYTGLVKTKQNIKVIECNGRRVIGSLRAMLAEAADAAKEKFWADVVEGKKYTGIIKSITNYGVFVDIGGVDGLVHISELSWNRIKHPSEICKVGDDINVYVKDLDKETKKVSLGYKDPSDNPWEKLKAEYPIGSVFTAPVVSLTKFGAFVRILPGIDGLVHISEISHDRVEKVQDALTVGQEVAVKLTDIDMDTKRISLSIKALLDVSEETAE